MNSIFKRRSIRQYEDKQITEEQIELLLKAAMSAPSACDTRPWEFIVILDKSVLNQIAEAHPHAKMVRHSNCAIVVCAKPEVQIGVSDGYFPQDCGAATQNILLQACELGLGTVWCGVYPKTDRIADIRRILHIPDEIIPFNVIAVGYAATDPGPSNRYDEKRVHRNQW